MKKSLLLLSLVALLGAGCSSTPMDSASEPGAANYYGADGVAVDAATAEALGLEELRGNTLLTQRSVFFDFNKYDIKDEYLDLIGAHAQYLNNHAPARMIIKGNADFRGSHEYNLSLGQKLHTDIGLNGESFNFGPRAEQNRTVSELLVDLLRHWDIATEAGFIITDNMPFHEASLLKLNCDKALSYLKWQATLGYTDTIKLTSEWYYNFYNDGVNNLTKTLIQIGEYESLAKERGLFWTE